MRNLGRWQRVEPEHCHGRHHPSQKAAVKAVNAAGRCHTSVGGFGDQRCGLAQGQRHVVGQGIDGASFTGDRQQGGHGGLVVAVRVVQFWAPLVLMATPTGFR